jgi:chromosomal replication initiation ATPase DnaA
MDGLSAPRPRVIEWDTLFSMVEDVSGVPKSDIESESRKRVFVIPRTALFYLGRVHTHWSYPWIGRRVGDRDHTTVLFGYRSMRDLVAQAPETLHGYRRQQVELVRETQRRIEKLPPTRKELAALATSSLCGSNEIFVD